MTASISEPFALASYRKPQNLTKGTEKHVFATHCASSGSSDGLVTVAANGDGVHVLDLSDLRPTISHSLGPATSFSCPPVSRTTTVDGKKLCSTHVAVGSSPDVSPETHSRTIWSWKENLDGSLSERALQKQKATEIPHHITTIILPEAGDDVVCIGPAGELTIVNSDRSSQRSLWKPSPEGHNASLLNRFVFIRSRCSFISSGSDSGHVIVYLYESEHDSQLRMRVLLIGEEFSVHEIGQCPIPRATSTPLVSSTLSEAGYFSFLDSDGNLSSYRLHTNPECRVESLEQLKLSITELSVANTSLLPLTSSLVLLASPSHNDTKVYLLIWDLLYSVVLASQSLAIPSTLSDIPTSSIQISLGSTSSSQALLILSPPASAGKKTTQSHSGRSSIFVIPYTCPNTSSLANALGKGDVSRDWLAIEASDIGLRLTANQRKVLDTMRSAMEQNKPEIASNAFFEFEKKEKEILEEGSVLLGHDFIRALLQVLLQPTKAASGAPYSSEVVRSLLEKKVVSSRMIDGGILPLLMARNDWGSVELALQRTHDLSEDELIDALRYITTSTRRSNPNAMQVDSQEPFLPLRRYLHLLISHPVCAAPSAALRTAIKKNLSEEASDVILVLNDLLNWLDRLATRDTSLFSKPKRTSKKKRTAPDTISGDFGADVEGDLPSLQQILPFLTCLIDASFVQLLSEPSARKILRSLQVHVEIYTRSTEVVDQSLSGFLEPFVAQHKQDKGEGSVEDGQSNGRQRRRKAHELSGANVGDYRLEELVL